MTLGIIADFNIDLFSRLVQNDKELELEVISFPFGQVYQSLISVANGEVPSSCYLGGNEETIQDSEKDKKIDNLVVWTRAETIFEQFYKAINFQEIDKSNLLKEVSQFADSLIEASHSVGNIFVMSWIIPTHHSGYGMSDYNQKFGLRYMLNMINNFLVDKVSSYSNIYMLDSSKYFLEIKNLNSSKMWYTAKVPYPIEIFKKATNDLKSSLKALVGKSKRLIVVDLDNTMWGGILGDLGWDGIKLGGHDYIGESYTDFQKALKSLTNRGILLAIASKNYEENAIEAIEKNTEMILKLEDFVTWKINWNDKAQNIIDIAKDVNLGLESIVFIDDNPAERGRVVEALPEVFVPDWPESPTDYAKALLSLDCFTTATLSEEDRKRSEMFIAERKRKKLSDNLSHHEWLKSIEMEVIIEKINTENQSRAIQLLNKTNQFNATTRRMSEPEFVRWSYEPKNSMWCFRVNDKFGDSGLTGVISYSNENNTVEIVDFIMSCRVMGREIERLMLGFVIKKARMIDATKVVVEYIESKRNKPMYDFLNNSNFIKIDNTYSWDCSNEYEDIDFIKIKEIN